MPTVVYFLLSAALYAAIPFSLISFNASPQQSSIIPVLLTASLSLPICAIYLRRANFRAAMLDLRLAAYGIASTIGFAAFLYLVSASQSTVSPVFTLVIVESWPLITAVAYPLMKLGDQRRVDMTAVLIGVLAVMGIAMIAAPELGKLASTTHGAGLDFHFVLPVLAMLAMTLSTLAKAKYVERSHTKYAVGPIASFFMMYGHSIALFPIIFAIMPPDLVSFDNMEALITPAAIALINIVSAILFSLGTLKLRNPTDLFIWFFAPVFSVLFHTIYKQELPTTYETAGIALIVGSNLFLSLRADSRHSYKFATLSLMLVGTACIFDVTSPIGEFYDIMAVLSIFFTITMAFMLERVSSRAEREMELFHQAFDLTTHHPDTATAHRLVKAYQRTSNVTRLQWLYRKLVQSGASDELLSLARDIGVSRQKGIRYSNVFSLALSTLAVLVIGLTSRPAGWQHDFFLMMFVPSMVYALTYLFDLNNSRFISMTDSTEGARSTSKLSFSLVEYVGLTQSEKRILRRSKRLNTVWSSVLVLFLVGNFSIGYVSKFHDLKWAKRPVAEADGSISIRPVRPEKGPH
ncbi:DMT family transporter [Pseudoprimorskyibacter insulae]|uniref:Uncharacterized protein n=1 Tax=Pseudoprimorskyibacter insulae TaxID=1695997 RepID=A0A2R8AWS2_9RHOB|nr:DMT family transporter [Pseudoprimorskyibacter insulae]SPF80377.1 hypothetical protein PRI8871_02182 [Pseudoprimorskyibacter insulae]